MILSKIFFTFTIFFEMTIMQHVYCQHYQYNLKMEKQRKRELAEMIDLEAEHVISYAYIIGKIGAKKMVFRYFILHCVSSSSGIH